MQATLNAGEWGRIKKLLARMKHGGLLRPDEPGAAEKVAVADERLFTAIQTNERHILHRLLPAFRCSKRPCGFLLPEKDDRNLISQAVLKNIH